MHSFTIKEFGCFEDNDDNDMAYAGNFNYFMQNSFHGDEDFDTKGIFFEIF